MQKYLSLVKNESQAYKLISPEEYKKYKIQEIKQEHSKFINAYGYILEIEGRRIYYSGDTKTISKSVLGAFKAESIRFDISRVNEYRDLNGIEKIYSSPYKRAYQTAQILNKNINV